MRSKIARPSWSGGIGDVRLLVRNHLENTVIGHLFNRADNGAFEMPQSFVAKAARTSESV